MDIPTRHAVVLLFVTVGLAACEKTEVVQPPAPKVTYADDVAAILQKHCAECHLAGQAGAEANDSLVDSYASVMRETRFGAVIDPGSAKTSSIYNMVTGDTNLTVTIPHGG